MFRRQLRESTRLLGRHLKLYQIHSATIESAVLEDDAVMTELSALRESGTAVGLSVSGPGQAATIERALRIGLFDSIQATWNLLERSAGPALQSAHDAGVAVVVKEVLANGVLAGVGAFPELDAYAVRNGTTTDVVALAAGLEQPWADVVLSGAVSREMLRSNLDASRGVAAGLRPTNDLGGLEVDAASYWQRRSRLPWS